METVAFEQLILGDSTDEIDIGSSDENRLAALSLVGQGQRTLDIASRDLDPTVLDNPEFIVAVRTLVLKSQHTKVRLLINQLAEVARAGHQLLNLASQISSFIEVRTPAEQHSHFNQAFLIVDGTGLIYRKLADRHDGVVSFNDPNRCNELLNDFDAIWEHAELDPNTHRLNI